jgi:hypothetical protein
MRPASEEFFRICRSPLKQTRALLASNPPGINGGSNPIPWARDPSVGLLRGHRWVPAALPWASGLPWPSSGGHRWSRLFLLSSRVGLAYASENARGCRGTESPTPEDQWK